MPSRSRWPLQQSQQVLPRSHDIQHFIDHCWLESDNEVVGEETSSSCSADSVPYERMLQIEGKFFALHDRFGFLAIALRLSTTVWKRR